MIITRTPFRISFFGGGTDYPSYYREHGGAVLSTTINKYCYLTCRYLPPFFDHKYRIRYTSREETQSIDEIVHPSVRACLKHVGLEDGIELIHTSDIPAMSGIGSSSAFTVGFLHALYALQGKLVTKRTLALEAMHIEQDVLKENVGSQDQVAAAFGGLNTIEFSGTDDVLVRPVPMLKEKLEYLQSCMLFSFTGFSRLASHIAEEQIRTIPQKLSELRAIRAMVGEAVEILNGDLGDLDEFGRLLDKSWKVKRALTSRITDSRIDTIYDTAIKAGALGGKLCGAGGGGFFLFFVPPHRRAAVEEALKVYLSVPFRFETLGSTTIYNAE